MRGGFRQCGPGICLRCGGERTIIGYSWGCRQCHRRQKAAWRKRNRPKCRIYLQRWREKRRNEAA
jgi:hypothetical protein